jgi:hypothetical protein
MPKWAIGALVLGPILSVATFLIFRSFNKSTDAIASADPSPESRLPTPSTLPSTGAPKDLLDSSELARLRSENMRLRDENTKLRESINAESTEMALLRDENAKMSQPAEANVSTITAADYSAYAGHCEPLLAALDRISADTETQVSDNDMARDISSADVELSKWQRNQKEPWTKFESAAELKSSASAFEQMQFYGKIARDTESTMIQYGSNDQLEALAKENDKKSTDFFGSAVRHLAQAKKLLDQGK